jgi:hypothetical protein
MGSYSVLKVGRVGLAWKYQIPTIATFLFGQTDYYYRRPRREGRDGADTGEATVGYGSTAAAVRRRLDEFGFTLAFWGGVCDELLDEIDEIQVEHVAMALAESEGTGVAATKELEAKAHAHLARPASRSAADDIAAFIELLRDGIAMADGPPGARKATRFERVGDEIFIDPSELAFSVGSDPLQVDAGVLRITPLIEHRIEDYPEVAELFLIRCLVDAVDGDAEVDLDLSDFDDEGEDFSNQPAELAEELLRKLQVYSRVFSILSENEPDVRRRAARGRARQLMQQLDTASTADAKGRVLEDLMAVVFQSHPDLLVSQRRLRLGDQEIDMVVDNHVDHGLWAKLESPLFLAECKNWGSSVGTPEIRDFETKVRDHQPHARLGILVSVGGFTREARTALARASREPYQLVLVARSDLEELIDTGFEVLPWLEGLITRFR